jgi:hypothetical protein
MKSLLSKILLLALAAFASVALAAEPTAGELQNQLRYARNQVLELKKKYTDDHPMVREQKAKVAALEKQLADAGGHPEANDNVLRTFSIDFPGGTLGDFIGALSKIEGVSISIISTGDQSDFAIKLPPFALRNTNAIVAVQVLARLLEPRGIDLNPMMSDQNSGVAVLSRRESKLAPTRTAPSQFESFQLAPYLADQSIEDIVGAIHAGWELDPQHDAKALQLKFHPQTSILLVSGPREGLDLTMKIISQLKAARPDAQKTAEAKAAAERARLDREKTRPPNGAAAAEKK